MMLRNNLAIAILIVTIGLATTGPVGASTNYVCWDGGFYISYPDNFHQVDYVLVDSYLRSRGADPSSMNYKAVFADTAARPFFAGEYFIVTYTPLDSVSQKETDSVLTFYRKGFETGVRHAPLATFLKTPSKNIPYYDKELGTIAFTNDIALSGDDSKRGMVVERIFRNGIAGFYFYAPDSVFMESTIPLVDSVISSFSTENLEQAVEKEPVKVADLPKADSKSATVDEDEKSVPWLYLVGPAVVLAIVLFGAARRRRKERR